MTSTREELRARFREYRKTGDRALRNELIEAHYGIVMHIARRYANRGEPLDDLVQVGQLGLLKAVERFDPERGFEFSTFASATIEGEMKRHFRDATWSIRVPRGAQELHLRLGTAANDLTQRLGRPPTVDEIASELGVTTDAALEAMDVGRAYRPTSLSAPRNAGEGPTYDDVLGDDDEELTLVEHRVVLERVVRRLPERERKIVYARFIEGRTQSDIAEELGISQMHVSRLLARTLRELRAYLEEEPTPQA